MKMRGLPGMLAPTYHELQVERSERPATSAACAIQLSSAAMLGSIRGGAAADVASVAACLAALADFAEQNADALDEIDLNPIKALPQGRGCVVVDALIVAKGATRG